MQVNIDLPEHINILSQYMRNLYADIAQKLRFSNIIFQRKQYLLHLRYCTGTLKSACLICQPLHTDSEGILKMQTADRTLA